MWLACMRVQCLINAHIANSFTSHTSPFRFCSDNLAIEKLAQTGRRRWKLFYNVYSFFVHLNFAMLFKTTSIEQVRLTDATTVTRSGGVYTHRFTKTFCPLPASDLIMVVTRSKDLTRRDDIDNARPSKALGRNFYARPIKSLRPIRDETTHSPLFLLRPIVCVDAPPFRHDLPHFDKL
jgi:hypothetical protein